MPFLAAAGALGVTRGRFLTAFTLARAARYSFVAWLGVLYGHQMVRWWNHYLARYSGAIGWAILALFIAAFGWGFWKWRTSGAHHAAQPAHS
jgi:membrane protein DedA with SNARE-associated domain